MRCWFVCTVLCVARLFGLYCGVEVFFSTVLCVVCLS